MTLPILRVAVAVPLRRTFDYLPPLDAAPAMLCVGARVRVPFGRGGAIGVIVALPSESAVENERLKRAEGLLDQGPLLPEEIIQLISWASAYYHHPLGEVWAAALPAPLRQGRAAERSVAARYYASGDAALLARAHRQRRLWEFLAGFTEGAGEVELEQFGEGWRPLLRRLLERGCAREERIAAGASPSGAGEAPPPLTPHQAEAVEAISGSLDRFHPFLLEGVTGSGKTEVYQRVIERVLALGKQALVLVPEISLTPQLVERFRRRFPVPMAVLHSGLNEGGRLDAWLAARSGEARVVIGTRSAIFVPLFKPGVIVVDEEHDPSFKQQEGFRYSARDLALIRGRLADIPVVLGSATPALESLHNVREGRYRHLRLPLRAGSALPPPIRLIDTKARPLDQGLSEPLVRAIAAHLEKGGQVLLFLNRRGYAPTLLCHACGWVGKCSRCDAHLTFHGRARRLRCHHCGADQPMFRHCPDCGSVEIVPLGQGTERVEEAMARRFPDVAVVRIDRDTTARKGSLESLLGEAHQGRARILIGTQMLAKGHHFPEVTLVGILNADQGLFSADFRAGERLAQLVVQVAGRAGRADRPGEVLIQTHHPEHPLLQTLVREGYPAFARIALEERRQALWPPFNHLALIRAESVREEAPFAFLGVVRIKAEELRVAGVEILGPVPAPMERRAGRFRAQLLLQARRRQELHRLLEPLVVQVEGMKETRTTRWSLDVDPIDLT